jgi:hypothetical protein
VTAAPAARPTQRPVDAAQRAADLGRAASTAVAWLALVLVAVALVIASVPVRNGRVQDCGAPLMFLLQGRPDTFPAADGTRPDDPNGPRLSPAEVARAYERPCHERVAARMVPAGALATAGMMLGLGAAAVVGRRAWVAHRRSAGPALG